MDGKLKFRQIGPCLFAVLVDILGFGLAFPVLTGLFTTGDFLPPGTSDALRYSYLAIGLALYPFFMFFGSSFMGDLSDVIGRRKVLLLCMGGFFIGFSLMGLGVEIKSLTVLFIGRGLTGITAASLPTTMAAIADLSTRETKAKNMSYVVMVQSIGFILGPLMGGLLSGSSKKSLLGEALPFFVAGILALAVMFTIARYFKESFEKRGNKKIHPLRLILVFVEAAKHPKVRLLTVAFVLHQIGIGLFMQLILIYMQRAFQYTTLGMGVFNSFMGVWFATGLLIVPYFSKKYPIEWLACLSLAVVGISNLLTSFSSGQWVIWGFLIPFGVASILAWSAMLTSFSHAVDEHSQGWALGITGAVVALAFMLTGFSPNLVPYFGVMPLIGLSGILLLIGAFVVLVYCRKHIKETP